MKNIENLESGEHVRNISETMKNVITIINNVLEPRGIDLALQEGHKIIIEEYINKNDVSQKEKMVFLACYKKLIKEYKNKKSVLELSLNHLSENAQPEKVDEDWLAFFFDKVKLISDESVQCMWARILASEVNSPGNYSKSLLHTLSIMETRQANLFCNIARFCMYDYKDKTVIQPFIFISTNAKLYNELGINLDSLTELEQLGLIYCDFKDEFIFLNKKIMRYGTNVIEIYGNINNDNKINVGNVRFTRNGLKLYEIVGESFKQYDKNIEEFIISKLHYRKCSIINKKADI